MTLFSCDITAAKREASPPDLAATMRIAAAQEKEPTLTGHGLYRYLPPAPQPCPQPAQLPSAVQLNNRYFSAHYSHFIMWHVHCKNK
jgi:hypothetical protein